MPRTENSIRLELHGFEMNLNSAQNEIFNRFNGIWPFMDRSLNWSRLIWAFVVIFAFYTSKFLGLVSLVVVSAYYSVKWLWTVTLGYRQIKTFQNKIRLVGSFRTAELSLENIRVLKVKKLIGIDKDRETLIIEETTSNRRFRISSYWSDWDKLKNFFDANGVLDQRDHVFAHPFRLAMTAGIFAGFLTHLGVVIVFRELNSDIGIGIAILVSCIVTTILWRIKSKDNYYPVKKHQTAET